MSGVTAHSTQPMQRILRLGHRKSLREGRKVGFALYLPLFRIRFLLFANIFCASLSSFAAGRRLELGLKDEKVIQPNQHNSNTPEHNIIFAALVRVGFCYFQVVRQNTFSQTNPRRRRVQPPQTREYHLLRALKTIPPKKNSILNQIPKRRPLFSLSRKANHLK